MIRYSTSKYGIGIKEVECIRETPKFVVYLNSYGKEWRSAKTTDYEQYHESLEMAKAYLTNRIRNQMAQAEKRLAELMDDLKK